MSQPRITFRWIHAIILFHYQAHTKLYETPSFLPNSEGIRKTQRPSEAYLDRWQRGYRRDPNVTGLHFLALVHFPPIVRS
jgi:hypothetical protein